MLRRNFFQRPTSQAPSAIPEINVININENACVLEPSARASIRVQTTSYSIATKPDTPMAMTAKRRSRLVTVGSSGDAGAADVSATKTVPSPAQLLTQGATAPSRRFIPPAATLEAAH